MKHSLTSSHFSLFYTLSSTFPLNTFKTLLSRHSQDTLDTPKTLLLSKRLRLDTFSSMSPDIG